MTEIYDLDAVAAETKRDPFMFRFGGQEWSLLHLADVDWRLIEQADSGNITAIREAIHAGFGCVHDGDQREHTATALEFDKLPQPITPMSALFDRWLTHAGLKPGEPEASPGSSESTAGPSNRASRRATKSTPVKSTRPARAR